MKSLLDLFEVLLDESGRQCSTSTRSDINHVRMRVEHEGFSFLTITLPEFCKDFERSLDQGSIDSGQFLGFTRAGGLPRLLSGFLRQVFDSTTGVLLDTPSIPAVRAVRQICRFFSKIEGDCSPARVTAALSGYVKCEQELADLVIPPDLLEDFGDMSVLLWSELFAKMDKSIYDGELLPKHGSGSTADRLRGNAKYEQTVWPTRSERTFPSWEMLISSWRHNDRLATIQFLEPGEEMPVKVITVPKTQKTPRIIAMEPTCMQYMQQAVLELFQREMRNDLFSQSLVCSDSQIPNQELARMGSLTGTLATLDLSEASDRVSYQLVKVLLSRNTLLREAVDDCRSSRASVPGHPEIISLVKFASMGSALCFPLESLVFATAVFVGIQKSLGHRLTRGDVNRLLGQVRVYGDDIIVPVDHVLSACATLEALGFKVNTSKSFWTGKFRESCGKDYYSGYDVSVVKCRDSLPRTRTDVRQLISLVSLRNQLFRASYYDTVEVLDRYVKRLIPFPYIMSEESAVLGRVDPSRVVIARVNPHLQIPEVKGMVAKPSIPVNKLDDYGALMKFFLKRTEEPYEAEHLELSGRSVSVALVTRWASP